MNQKINCLYKHFKDTPHKLKIICDWDEVIQTHEPYCLWIANLENDKELKYKQFSDFFKDFWEGINKDKWQINYSSYGSSLKSNNDKILEEQVKIKNSPDLYQNQPFLTIAKELLMLIKVDKIEQLIFLSAYDKRKFPQLDPRKLEIFNQTFGKYPFCSLRLIGFDSDSQGANKADWVKTNAPDFDVVIDDNPYICRSLIELNNEKISTDCLECQNEKETDNCDNCGKQACYGCLGRGGHDGNRLYCDTCYRQIEGVKSDQRIIKTQEKNEEEDLKVYSWGIGKKIIVIAPHYHAIESQHHQDVILLKTSVSGLKKEDFNSL
ncbi:MAG: hypothetical protein LBR43_02940 [Spiroplasmataceae bacterium]|nr:hypothetical protein [Spiroplasmataceae bacterium]